MDKICAAIDCQGFNLPSGFIPREIAIMSDKFSQCMELNTQLDYRNMSESDKRTINTSTQEIHGLHCYPFNPKDACFLYNSDEIGSIINLWYNIIATEDQPLFAYKNHQLGEILKKLNIPSYNLDDDETIPSYEIIKEKFGDNYLCCYHKRPPKFKRISLNCAYRKANQLFRIIRGRYNFILI